jgi:hypothetical protein
MRRLLLAAASAALFISPAFAQLSPGSDGGVNASASAAPGPDCAAIPDAPADHPCTPREAGGLGLALSTAPSQATGTITSIDVAAGTVTLDDGKSFAIVKIGQRVTISFMSHDGKLMASDLKPATSEEPPEPAVPPENRY